MVKYELTVVKYGYAVVYAESESEAMSLVGSMEEDEFEWTSGVYPERAEEKLEFR